LVLVFDEATDAPVLFGLTSYGPQIALGLNVCALKAPAVFSWVPAFSKLISDTLNRRRDRRSPEAGP
jgi:hypothetical protein